MKSPYKLLVFDHDGTLVDSQHRIVEAMDLACVAQGLPIVPAERVLRFVGLRLEEAIANLLPGEEESRVAAVTRSFREAFVAMRARADYEEPLFPGVNDMLSALNNAGFILGIATGKNRRGLLHSLDWHGLSDHFVTLQTADDGPGKPSPNMLLRAMSEVGAEPEETLMIGDTTFDILMARNARMIGIGVAWGYHDPQELIAAGARRIAKTVPELTSLIAGKNTEI